MSPSFFIIGAPKCATTWASEVLKNSRGIFVPEIKDIYFFDENYARGIKWYLSFFSRSNKGDICGELSHNYLYSDVALDRLSSFCPDAKIVILLRRPSERAYAHAKCFVRDGLVTSPGQALEKYHKFVVEWSRYERFLPSVYARFSNVHIIFQEDIALDSERVATELVKFIGGRSDSGVDVVTSRVGKVLSSSAPRNPMLTRLAKWLATSLRKMGWHWLLAKLRGSATLASLLYTSWSAQRDEPAVASHLRDVLRNSDLSYDQLRLSNDKECRGALEKEPQ